MGPDVSPGDGLSRYTDNPNQGPACAITAGAGAIYRNYLVRLGGGAFGNVPAWISDAIGQALEYVAGHDIEVRAVMKRHQASRCLQWVHAVKETSATAMT